MARDAPGATAVRPIRTKPTAHGFVTCSRGYAHDLGIHSGCSGAPVARTGRPLSLVAVGKPPVGEMTTHIAPRTKAQLLALVETLEHDKNLQAILLRNAERDMRSLRLENERLRAALTTIRRIAES